MEAASTSSKKSSSNSQQRRHLSNKQQPLSNNENGNGNKKNNTTQHNSNNTTTATTPQRQQHHNSNNTTTATTPQQQQHHNSNDTTTPTLTRSWCTFSTGRKRHVFFLEPLKVSRLAVASRRQPEAMVSGSRFLTRSEISAILWGARKGKEKRSVLSTRSRCSHIRDSASSCTMSEPCAFFKIW